MDTAFASTPGPWLEVDQWFNTEQPLDMPDLAGQVLVVLLFQMLCKDCTACSLPQLERLQAQFARAPLSVLAVHAVHERHNDMTPVALQRFLLKSGYRFPVCVDRPGTRWPVPKSMGNLRLRSTPSLLIFDAQGRERNRHIGLASDLVVGANVAWLLAEHAMMQRGQGREASSPLSTVDP